MLIGIARETFPDEKRVALVPAAVPMLVERGHAVRIETGAGLAAGYPDAAYREQKAEIITARDAVVSAADVVFAVRAGGANPERGAADLGFLRPEQTLIGFLEPFDTDNAAALARTGVTAFALELIPRISRAQSMDALSSMASLAGYKAVLLAANALPKLFPMMITAAGSLSAARVFVVGAGVAGLQACATAKRLGAVVSAYDVRSTVREQVESVGARFVAFDLDTGDSEDAGGYARDRGDDFYRRQQRAMAQVVARQDVVITTAAVPGKTAPVLITEDMVRAMPPGSVLVDLAAERGGNCSLTRPGETVQAHGVTILGPLNLPAALPHHASLMLSKNITALFLHLFGAEGGRKVRDAQDAIYKGALMCTRGAVVHPMLLQPAGPVA